MQFRWCKLFSFDNLDWFLSFVQRSQFLRILLVRNHHWFRYWLVNKQSICHLILVFTEMDVPRHGRGTQLNHALYERSINKLRIHKQKCWDKLIYLQITLLFNNGDCKYHQSVTQTWWQYVRVPVAFIFLHRYPYLSKATYIECYIID